MKIFPCPDNSSETIPADVLMACLIQQDTSLANAKGMVDVALSLKRNKQTAFCQLPFCTTVEAEAMGAVITSGECYTSPRINKYTYSSLDSLSVRPTVDMLSGRMGETLKAIRVLAQQGEAVCLNLCGPFTVLSGLIDNLSLYKAMRKTPELFETVLHQLEKDLVYYALKAIEYGARIISYSDPTGAIEILGPARNLSFSLPSSFRLLSMIQQQTTTDIIIHLCGKTSTNLVSAGLAEAKLISLEESTNYSHAILQMINKKDVCFIGHGCIKANKPSIRRLWQLLLKSEPPA